MEFSTIEQIENNLREDYMSSLNLEDAQDNFILLKREITIELTNSVNRVNSIRSQIDRFESKFDFDRQKWFFEDRGDRLLYSLKRFKIKNVPPHVRHWIEIDLIMNGHGILDYAQKTEFYVDIKIYKWLKSQIDTPSVSKLKTTPSVSKEPKPKVVDEYKRIFDRYNCHVKIDKMSETDARLKIMAELKIGKTKFYDSINFCKSLKIK